VSATVDFFSIEAIKRFVAKLVAKSITQSQQTPQVLVVIGQEKLSQKHGTRFGEFRIVCFLSHSFSKIEQYR
jgi:hypothetical protein